MFKVEQNACLYHDEVSDGIMPLSFCINRPVPKGGSGGSEEPSHAATRSAQPNGIFFLVSVYFFERTMLQSLCVYCQNA